MTPKAAKIPNADHPITVETASGRVIVAVAGRTLIDTAQALILREASYPPVFYLPRADIDMAQLEPSDTTSYCPYKGDCSYYSLPAGGERSRNAVWSYENPHEAVAEIKGYLAFYPDRVDSIVHLPAA